MKNADLERIKKYLHVTMNQTQGFEHSLRRTKIVATVGPASSDYDVLLDLVRAGVNVIRLNFSHGTHEDKQKVIDYIRKINKAEPYNISLLGDLQGPKLRVGDIEGGAIDLQNGDELLLTNTPCVGTKERVYVSYPNLHNDVVVGNRILLDDGKLVVRVLSVQANNDVLVKIENGGLLKPNKGINLPDTVTTLPALTEQDKNDLQFIIKQKLDWVALSFVRKAEDIEQLRGILDEHNATTKIIAKIEKPDAVINIDSIINASDAIMIARGDLGVEVPVEKLPLIQKDIIARCIRASKPVIVATQMMESMIENVQLNRSEATDVANSILDGTDAVMLSGETATGKHPVLVVKTMYNIIRQVELGAFRFNYGFNDQVDASKENFIEKMIAYNACKIASEINSRAIVGMTQTGKTAFMISSYRPKSAIYIFTKKKYIVTQLGLSWGVRAFFYDEEESIDKIFFDLCTILQKRKFLTKGDRVVHTGSIPIESHLPTNMIKVDTIK